MPYFVLAADNQKYGPADIATLNEWIQENRIGPETVLEDEASGNREPAKMIQGLNFTFRGPVMPPPAAVVPPPSYEELYSGYPRPEPYVPPVKKDVHGHLISAIATSVLALIVTLFTVRYSIIWLPLSFYYAYRSIYNDENRWGWIAVGISLLNIAIIVFKFTH